MVLFYFLLYFKGYFLNKYILLQFNSEKFFQHPKAGVSLASQFTYSFLFLLHYFSK